MGINYFLYFFFNCILACQVQGNKWDVIVSFLSLTIPDTPWDFAACKNDSSVKVSLSVLGVLAKNDEGITKGITKIINNAKAVILGFSLKIKRFTRNNLKHPIYFTYACVCSLYKSYYEDYGQTVERCCVYSHP